MRSVLGGLNVLILMILAAMLLPLIIGPFVVVYEFARAGEYTVAATIGSAFGVCVALVLRAVRRGELGVGTFVVALMFAAFVVLMATRLPR